MIQEAYVSLSTAKLLKEKEFDEPCYMSYWLRTKDSIELTHLEQNSNKYSDCIYAPSLQKAMRWVREVHNIIIVCTPSVICSDSLQWISSIRTYNAEENYLEDQGIVGNYDTYEQSCEAAIKYCLENLI